MSNYTAHPLIFLRFLLSSLFVMPVLFWMGVFLMSWVIEGLVSVLTTLEVLLGMEVLERRLLLVLIIVILHLERRGINIQF